MVVNTDCVHVCPCCEYEPGDGVCLCGHPWTGHEFDLIPEGVCTTRIPCSCGEVS